MSELPWKLFEKTGNLEAYLLMKQVEELSEEKQMRTRKNCHLFHR